MYIQNRGTYRICARALWANNLQKEEIFYAQNHNQPTSSSTWKARESNHILHILSG